VAVVEVGSYERVDDHFFRVRIKAGRIEPDTAVRSPSTDKPLHLHPMNEASVVMHRDLTLEPSRFSAASQPPGSVPPSSWELGEMW
jgi:hypothetical protein